jgi:hypothetical protein
MTLQKISLSIKRQVQNGLLRREEEKEKRKQKLKQKKRNKFLYNIKNSILELEWRFFLSSYFGMDYLAVVLFRVLKEILPKKKVLLQSCI